MEAIQILIFVVIIAIAVMRQLSKAKKEAASTDSQSVLNPVEIATEEESDISSTAAARRFQRPFSSAKPIQPIAQVVTEPKTPDKAEQIKLRTRKDARRAFIYAEIFKRKY